MARSKPRWIARSSGLAYTLPEATRCATHSAIDHRPSDGCQFSCASVSPSISAATSRPTDSKPRTYSSSAWSGSSPYTGDTSVVSRLGCPTGSLALPIARLSQDGLGLYLHEHFGRDECAHLDHARGGADLPEELAMS